jgi:hypothetical protein
MFKTNVHRKEVVNESGFPLFAHAKPHLFSMVNDLFLERTMFETRFVKVLKASVASRWYHRLRNFILSKGGAKRTLVSSNW